MFNKKSGQMGETITWVIATIVIIVILTISIFISTSYIGGKKTISSPKTNDILASESFFAYLLTEDDSGQTVYEQLKRENNLNDFNGDLALKIFEEFYLKDYWLVWFAIYSKPNDIIHNEYFPKPPPCGAGISNEVELEENKYILLSLTEHC